MQVAQFASQKMETKIPKLAIIAGNGSIPFYLVEECKTKGREYCLIIIDGHGKELSEKYKPDFIVSLSKMGKAIKYVKKLNIKDQFNFFKSPKNYKKFIFLFRSINEHSKDN